MKKIIFLISLLLVSLSKVFAYDLTDTFYYDHNLPNMYVSKVKDGVLKNTATFMLHRSDSGIVYCIDPFISEIDGTYEGYIGYNSSFGLTKDQINRMNLIAHYGYGYQNHNDLKWYGVTQYLIWQTLNLDDIYYTDSYYGNKVTLYQNEINEINNLVNNHYIVPSFNGKNYDFSIQESYTLEDTNNVLQYYDLEYDHNLKVEKNGNKLIISSDKPGEYSIKLVKKSQVLNDYILYKNNARQSMIYPGKYDDVVASLNVNFYDGKIEITKQDRETKLPQGQATFEGAIYGLYNENDELVDQVTLDETGSGIFEHLPLKQYYVKEIQASKGYQLDSTKYYVHLSNEQLGVKLDVFEDVIKNKIKIIKMYGNSITNNYHLESGVSFELYDSFNNYINTYKTDENGEITLELPYGKYILKQVDGMEYFTINKPLELNITEVNEDIQIILKDEEEIRYGNLQVQKKGDDGKLLDGVKFKVYAKEDIVSLSGDIYYHKDDLIGEITIKDGYGYLDNLYYGKYYLIETQGIDGYILDKNPIDFNINDELTSIEVINKHNNIPNTGKNEIDYIKILANSLIIIGIIISIYVFKKIYTDN